MKVLCATCEKVAMYIQELNLLVIWCVKESHGFSLFELFHY